MKRLLSVLMFLGIAVGLMAGTIEVITGGTQVATYTLDVQGDFIKSPSGNRVEINESGQMHVVMRGAVDPNNSTDTPLASGAQFLGNPTDILDYGIVFVAVYSDQSGALSMQQSCDGTNWDVTDDYNISATHGKTFSIQPACRYFRVVYTNGGLPQTAFRLSTTLKKMNSKPSSHRISDSIVDDDDAELMKSVLTAEDDNGDFINIRAIQGDTGHNLKVSLDQVESTTNSVQVIDYAHGELHEGRHFVIRDYMSLPKAGTRDILFVTPDTPRWCHMVYSYESNDAAVVGQFFEGPTVSASGTPALTVNRNRNSAYTAGLQIYYAPTVTATGTLLAARAVGSGKNSGGAMRDNAEIVLKQNTLYLLRITEGNVAATNLNWEFDWYEHTNK